MGTRFLHQQPSFVVQWPGLPKTHLYDLTTIDPPCPEHLACSPQNSWRAPWSVQPVLLYFRDLACHPSKHPARDDFAADDAYFARPAVRDGGWWRMFLSSGDVSLSLAHTMRMYPITRRPWLMRTRAWFGGESSSYRGGSGSPRMM